MCVAEARYALRAVEPLWHALAHEATEGSKALAVGNGVPGGDALVLLSPAATEHGWHAQREHRLAFGLDISHYADELRGDPRPPDALLERWTWAWRVQLGHQVQQEGQGLAASVRYLDEHLHEAARHAMFVPFHRDLERCQRQLEDVLHAGERAEVSRVPCLDCGARLHKTWGTTPGQDHHVCPRCGQRYDQARFQRAKHQHLASKGADRYVPIADAVAAVGRPEQTVRSWMRRGLVAYDREPTTKRLVVWWPDVREQDLASRAKPKPSPSKEQ